MTHWTLGRPSAGFMMCPYNRTANDKSKTSKKSMKKIPPEITCRRANLFAAINDTLNMYQSNVYHYVICQMVSNSEREKNKKPHHHLTITTRDDEIEF